MKTRKLAAFRRYPARRNLGRRTRSRDRHGVGDTFGLRDKKGGVKRGSEIIVSVHALDIMKMAHDAVGLLMCD